MLPRVAILGRPNVGKSTLFNRLVGKKLAIVDDRPGVTRDRRYGQARLGDLDFEVIDTAGYEEAGVESLEGRMRLQTEAAIEEADVLVFVIDARAGLTPLDHSFGEMLRTCDKPLVLVANKAEGAKAEAGFYEAYELGFGEPVGLSAEHGDGLADLYAGLQPHLDPIIERYKAEAEAKLEAEEAAFHAQQAEELEEGEEPEYGFVPEEEPKALNVAIVGRPNAGKSTLINAYLGEDRLLTGPEAGITRDSIAIDWEWNGQPVRLFDTAGMRKKARVQEKLEKLSVADSLRAIRFAHVVVVLIDAETPFEKQDLQIADLCEREGRAIVIALNKWDLIPDKQERLKELRAELAHSLPQITGVPFVTLSALEERGLDRLMEGVFKAYEVWNTRISTSKLNRWLDGVLAHHPPPAPGGRRIKIRYITQVNTRPPTFASFCSLPEDMPAAYKRYLVNSLRETFKMPGTPIRLMWRKGENPYASRAKKRK